MEIAQVLGDEFEFLGQDVSDEDVETVYEIIQGRYPRHVVKAALRVEPRRESDHELALSLVITNLTSIDGICEDVIIKKEEAWLKEHLRRKPVMKTCSTCLEDFSVEDMYTVNCAAAHRFCFDCTRRYVVARLQEGQAPMCGAQDCGHVMHVDELKLLGLEPKLIEKALELSLQAVLTTTRLDSPTTYVAGPTRDCNQYYEVSRSERQPVSCIACRAAPFCSLCKRPYHYGVSCDEVHRIYQRWFAWERHGRAAYRKRHAEYEAESQRYEEARAAVESENKALREAYDAYLLNEQAIAQDSKRCPHCSRVIQRVKGTCASMVCGRDYHSGSLAINGCGKTFNWDKAPKYVPVAVAEPPLKTFDMAPPQLEGAQGNDFCCDYCHAPIKGYRFRCVNCPSYSLCYKCESIYPAFHNATHLFEVL